MVLRFLVSAVALQFKKKRQFKLIKIEWPTPPFLLWYPKRTFMRLEKECFLNFMLFSPDTSCDDFYSRSATCQEHACDQQRLELNYHSFNAQEFGFSHYQTKYLKYIQNIRKWNILHRLFLQLLCLNISLSVPVHSSFCFRRKSWIALLLSWSRK